MVTEPVNLWLSSSVLPKLLDPLSNKIEELTMETSNWSAVILPKTLKSPDISAELEMDSEPVIDASNIFMQKRYYTHINTEYIPFLFRN